MNRTQLATPNNEADRTITLQISGNRLVQVLNSLDGMAYQAGLLKLSGNGAVGTNAGMIETHEITEAIRDELSRQRMSNYKAPQFKSFSEVIFHIESSELAAHFGILEFRIAVCDTLAFIYGFDSFKVFTVIESRLNRIESKCHYKGKWFSTLTRPQLISLRNLYMRSSQKRDGMTYRQFRKSGAWSFGAFMVPFCSMYVGIEPDGYTHS